MSEIRTRPIALVDLWPEWMDSYVAKRQRIGIAFNCPCRRTSCPQRERIWVLFANPVDGGRPEYRGPHWVRTGDSYEDLSLTPSIHIIGHWHGWLHAGIVESV